jgi:hypothetical protein
MGQDGGDVVRLAHGHVSETLSMGKSRNIDEATRSALNLLARHGISPDAQNYAACFEYFLGRNQALVDDVKALLGEGSPISEPRIREIHGRHFGMLGEIGEIRETSRKIHEVVSGILEPLRQAGQDQSAFGENLEGFFGQLTEEVSASEAAMLVQGILGLGGGDAGAGHLARDPTDHGSE